MSCKPASGLCVLTLVIVWLYAPSVAEARVFRARFEPETLELQDPGNLEIDYELGGLYGDGVDGSRLILSDFAVELGIFDWFEVNIDGAFSLTQLGTGEVGMGGEPLWTSGRFELLNLEDEEHRNFGIGVQVGPRFRTVDNARGVGLGALLLVGGGTKKLRAVANLGVFVDREQAVALAYGGSVQYDLERERKGRTRKWVLQAQLAAAQYFGDLGEDYDPNQVFLLAGFGTDVTKDLMLSVLALSGPFDRGDRVGLMLAATWDKKLW